MADEAAERVARDIVAAWAAVSVDDVGFKIDGAWTYGNLVTRIGNALLTHARALAQAEREREQAHVCPACGETTIAQDSAIVADLRAEVERLTARLQEEMDWHAAAVEGQQKAEADLARVRADNEHLKRAMDEANAEVLRLRAALEGRG